MSSISILKAQSLMNCDWMDMGYMPIPEQVPVQGLGCMDYTDLCRTLPFGYLGLSPPRPPKLTVGEVSGVPRGKARCCYQKNDERVQVGQKQHMAYS